MKVRPPAAAAKLLAPLADAARTQGAALYAVGGPVRDWLLDRKTLDIDLTVAGDPDPVAHAAARLLGGTVEPFGRFGTRRVNAESEFRVDVATTRQERYDAPAALPTVERTGVPIEKDLIRRDFTVNAMAVRLDDGSHELCDPYGGLKDLKAGVVRALHGESFRDDPTRVFRGARFLSRFGFKPAPGFVEDAKAALAHAKTLSPHRRLHELLLIVADEDPSGALERLKAWGYLDLLGFSEWPKKWPKTRDERLAALALSMRRDDGESWLKSFPFDRHLRSQLEAVLALAYSDRAPRAVPDPFVARAVRAFLPKLPPAALTACFLTGADLVAQGAWPGPAIQKVLDEAAKLQREGKLRTRAAALAWLKKRPANER